MGERIGRIFDSLEPAFQEHAFPESGRDRSWSSRPVEVGTEASPTTGRGYQNTFQDDRIVDLPSRQEAFFKRLQAFTAIGGSFANVTELRPDKTSLPNGPSNKSPPHRNEDAWQMFMSGQWYDYVVCLDHSIRCYPTFGIKRPKCGHTMLAVPVSWGSPPEFSDEPVVMAGDFCVLKDSEGNASSLILTNNSGHFKPKACDLPNAVAAFVKAGMPENRIYLWSGPNNIVALRRHLSRAQGESIEAFAQVLAGEDLLNPYVMVSHWEKQR